MYAYSYKEDYQWDLAGNRLVWYGSGWEFDEASDIHSAAVNGGARELFSPHGCCVWIDATDVALSIVLSIASFMRFGCSGSMWKSMLPVVNIFGIILLISLSLVVYKRSGFLVWTEIDCITIFNGIAVEIWRELVNWWNLGIGSAIIKVAIARSFIVWN